MNALMGKPKNRNNNGRAMSHPYIFYKDNPVVRTEPVETPHGVSVISMG
jgi:hypothetical protein